MSRRGTRGARQGGSKRNRGSHNRARNDRDEFRSTVPGWARFAAMIVLAAMVLGVLATVFASRGGTLPRQTRTVQTANTDEPAALVLKEQTPWVGPGGLFEAEVRLPEDHGAGELQGTVREPITEAADLDTDPDDGFGPIVAEVPTVPVTASSDEVTLRVPIAGREPRRDAVELDGGVYPVVIDFVPDDGDRIRLVSSMIVLPSTRIEPRPLAIVVELSAAVSWADDAVQLADSSDLVGALVLLNAYGEAPTTVRLTPAVADAITQPGANGDLATELRTLAANPRAQFLNGPYVDVPVGAWANSGLSLAVIDQFEAGFAALNSLRDGSIDGSTWLLGSTDSDPTMAWFAARGVRYLVVGPERLRSGEPDQTGNPDDDRADDPGFDPFIVGPKKMVALPAQRLDPQGGAPAVHRLLATSALGVVDRSPKDDSAPPVSQAPTVVVVDAADGAGRSQLRTLLEAVVQPGGPLQGRTVTEVGGALNLGSLPSGSLAPAEPPALGDTAKDLGDMSGDIDAFVATVGADDPRADAWRRTMLVAGASGGPERKVLVTRVHDDIRMSLMGVELPTTDLITVTSHRADLPIAIRNPTTRRMRLAMQLDSSDLVIDTPSQVIELAPGETVDLRVPVELNRAGEFSLQVRLTTRDGRFLLAQQELRVRSTSVPGAGIAVSVGALLFLAVWWIRHLRRARRVSDPPSIPVESASPTDASLEQPVP